MKKEEELKATALKTLMEERFAVPAHVSSGDKLLETESLMLDIIVLSEDNLSLRQRLNTLEAENGARELNKLKSVLYQRMAENRSVDIEKSTMTVDYKTKTVKIAAK